MEGLFDKKHIYGNFQDQPDSNRRNQFPLDIETLEALQNNTSLAAVIGNLTGSDKAILCGCDGTPRTEGYVWMKTPRAPITGELLYYPGGGAGSDSDQCHIVEVDSDITIDSTTYAEAYTTRHLANGAGATTYTFGTFAKVTLAGLLDKIQEQHDNIEALKNNAQYTFVRGMIMLWSGTIATIPAGWHLCDGTNGTPNLMDRFVVCASTDNINDPLHYYTPGPNYANPEIGGAEYHRHHCTVTLQAGDLPAHRHAFSGDDMLKEGCYNTAMNNETAHPAGNCGATGTETGKNYLTDNDIYATDGTLVNAATSKTLAFYTASSDALPPYYALAYIMKL